MFHNDSSKLIIAGPCSAESETQIATTCFEAQKRSIAYIRVNLWKPRTEPGGFEGLGNSGLYLLRMVAQLGLNPALEVALPEHAQLAMDTVFAANPHVKLLLWIGARNQNHWLQHAIAATIAQDQRVLLMLKNPTSPSLRHWKGAVAHVQSEGVRAENLLLCMRGFEVPAECNPHGYRNAPDYIMMDRIHRELGLPVLFDPSHTGGSVAKVFDVMQQAEPIAHQYGYIVEVHPDPSQALTDKVQQLTWPQFDQLMAMKQAVPA